MAEYAYEHLSPHGFQRLAQALVVAAYPDAQAFPVNESDGGRDATARRAEIVFQVKFTRDPSKVRDPVSWLRKALRDDMPAVARLATHGKLKEYILITNVRGTGKPQTGTIDRLNQELSSIIATPAMAWWRDDLNARVDSIREVKWAYPAILSGLDAVRALLQELWTEDRSRRHNAVRAMLNKQYDDETKVRFKQVELQSDLLELFIDVPLTPGDRTEKVLTQEKSNVLRQIYVEDPSKSASRDYINHPHDGAIHSIPATDVEQLSVGAAFLFTHPAGVRAFRHSVLEGAPGQGKSTLLQYICQLHRMRLLGRDEDLGRVPKHFRDVPIRVPLKVDLRDLAMWLNDRNPFGPKRGMPQGAQPSLESFLAEMIHVLSGGVEFGVYDLHALLDAAPSIIVLDALDEVADVRDRERVVACINESVARIELHSGEAQVIVTSRPSAYAGVIGPTKQKFDYFQLVAVRRGQIDDYATRWISANNVRTEEARDIRTTLQLRLDEPHIRDLARNPMQLAILLALVRRKGISLPDKRSDFYEKYMELFFDRESEKSESVREHRPLLVQIHGYLGWLLHAGAELQNSDVPGGRIRTEHLQRILREYLEREQRPVELVDELFSDVTLRVVAITSRVNGTYEFEVQPLREYYAAKHLYETAPPSRVGEPQSGSIPDRFAAIAGSPYWTNVARFVAGFYKHGELDSLASQIADLVESEADRPRSHGRRLGALLLADWVFAQSVRATANAVAVVTDDLAWRTVWSGREWPAPGERVARKVVTESAMNRLASSKPLSSQTRDDLVRVVRRTADPELNVPEWWVNMLHADAARTGYWLKVGLELDVVRQLSSESRARMFEALDRDTGIRMAVASGASEAVEEQEVLAQRAVRLILDSSCPVQRWGTSQVLGAFATLVGAAQVEYSWSGEVPTFTGLFGEEQLPTRAAPTTRLVHEVVAGVREEVANRVAAADKGAYNYRTSNAVLVDAMDQVVAALGDGIILAARAAGFARRFEARDGDDRALLDEGIPWRERAKAAVTFARRASWWRRQRPETSAQCMIWSLFVIGVAPPAAIEEIADEAAAVLDQMDDRAFDAVRVQVWRLITMQHGRGSAADRLVRLVENTESERLAGLLLLRLGIDRQAEALRSPAAPVIGRNPFVDGVRLELALQELERSTDPDAQRALLDRIRELTFADAVYPAWSGRALSGSSLGRVAIVETILQDPAAYPFILVRIAEDSAARYHERRQKPIATVAAASGWFTADG